MDGPKLQGDQHKGLDEAQVRHIVLEEHLRFVEILKEEVIRTPMRADGNLNHRDFHETLGIVEEKIRSRIVV